MQIHVVAVFLSILPLFVIIHYPRCFWSFCTPLRIGGSTSSWTQFSYLSARRAPQFDLKLTKFALKASCFLAVECLCLFESPVFLSSRRISPRFHENLLGLRLVANLGWTWRKWKKNRALRVSHGPLLLLLRIQNSSIHMNSTPLNDTTPT